MSTFEVTAGAALSICVGTSLFYVVSLYIWANTLNRDEPSIIRKRSLSTLVVSIVAVATVRLTSTGWASCIEKLGIGGAPWSNVRASMAGLLLTVILFAGPLCQPTVLCTAPSYFSLATDWLIHQPKWLLLRNFVVSPVTEELVFRAVFIAILNEPFGSVRSVLIAAIIFSLAHLHHLVEAVSKGAGADFLQVLCGSLVQASYTLLFGIYAGYLFVITGSLMCCILVHAFCNFVGPPPIWEFFLTAECLQMPEEVFNQKRLQLSLVYVVGFISFCVLLTLSSSFAISASSF